MTGSSTALLRTRLLVAYSVLGPFTSLALSAAAGTLADAAVWTLVGFQILVAGGVFGILRPGSCRRSTWRTLGAALVLVGPLLFMASSSIPVFVLLDPGPGTVGVDFGSPFVWATFWLAGALFGCAVAALVSAAGGFVSAEQASRDTGSAESTTRPRGPRAKDFVRLGAVSITLLVVAIGSQFAYYVLSFPFALAKSHTEGNVPDRAEFDAYLERDLTAYFRSADSSITKVEYDLLRRHPTQSGVAYPKYYAWVRVSSTMGAVSEGAVRLAAVDRLRFDVTDFLPRDTVLSDPRIVRELFPAALNEEIMRRARGSSLRS
jgi:hypothetical protein